MSSVEGILIKGQSQCHLPGYRGWTKIRRQDTTEAIIDAVTCTLTRPQLLFVGRHDEAAGCPRSAARSRCAPNRPGRSRSNWPLRAPDTPGRA
ncbi:hypothetical protein ACFVZ4_20230 [Streptomyces goshikiensis]|uniref:hypothetical protein n=1 Tax=Streptomyces goshikiensis TaxID=1942 RepID=UPI003697284F